MKSLRHRFAKCFSVLFFLFSLQGNLAAQQSSESLTTVLRNAIIVTVSDPQPFVGTLIIRDGKIDGVYKQDSDDPLPQWDDKDSIVYDLSGYTITPGLIDCRSVLHLESGAASETSSNASLDIVTGIDPFLEDWREVVSQGVTTVGVRPGGSLGGYAAALSVIPSEQTSDIILKDQIALVASIGINANSSTARYQEFNRLKTAIQRVIDGEAAEKEKEQEEAKEESQEAEKEESEEQPATPTGTRAGDAAPAGRVTAPSRTNELLKRVVKKEIPLHIRVKHSDVIGWVLAMQAEFDLRIVLEDLAEGSRHAEKIDNLNIPLIVGPFGFTPQTTSDSRKDFDFTWVSRHAADGGIVAVSPFSTQSRGSRMIRINLSAAVGEISLAPSDALKAVTINAARILGISDLAGTIEAGKRADLAVFAGDPLDPSTPVQLVFNGGHLVFEGNADHPESMVSTNQDSIDLQLPDTLPDRYAIRSKFVYQNGKFAEATIIVDKGKIEVLNGQDQSLPTFDLGEAVVTPGLVAACSHLGHQSQLTGNPESDATLFRAVDVFDSDRKPVERMMSAGFLNIGFAPLPSSTSAGAVGQIRLSPVPQIVDPHIASQFVFSNAARNNERYPASLTGQNDFVNQIVDLRFPQSRLYVTAGMDRILEMEKQEIISRLKSKDARALFVVGDALEASLAADLVQQHDLAATLWIDSISSEMTSELLDRKLGVIISAAGSNEYDQYFHQIVQLIEGGIEIGFAGENAADIRVTAALLASQGASKSSLLKAITDGGAAIAGMPTGTAKLEPGRQADFVIWSGSPLNLSAQPMAIVIDGKRTLTPQTKR